MKIAGWILLGIGILSFIGAVSAGHSVFGPCFFTGLGIAFLCIASQKKKNNKQ